MDSAEIRLALEDKIREKARMLRAQSDLTAAAVRTSPEVLLKSCDKLAMLADDIKILAEAIRRILETQKNKRESNGNHWDKESSRLGI